MLKLHGFRLSNYYSIVKMTLLEKGLEFEEVDSRGVKGEEFRRRSPMGKVPCLETAQGFITETDAIVEYLEDLGQGPSFLPADPFLRAKNRELMKYCELYVELPARRLYGEVFFKKAAKSDEEKAEIRAQLEQGFAALQSLASFNPYLTGAQITCADFFFQYCVGLATLASKKGLNWDSFNEVPHIRDLLNLIGQRESAKKIKADQAAG